MCHLFLSGNWRPSYEVFLFWQILLGMPFHQIFTILSTFYLVRLKKREAEWIVTKVLTRFFYFPNLDTYRDRLDLTQDKQDLPWCTLPSCSPSQLFSLCLLLAISCCYSLEFKDPCCGVSLVSRPSSVSCCGYLPCATSSQNTVLPSLQWCQVTRIIILSSAVLTCWYLFIVTSPRVARTLIDQLPSFKQRT